MLKMLMFSKLDQQGSAEADTAAVVTSLRCSLTPGVGCSRFAVVGNPIMLQLHRFMIAVARVSVNHDGGVG